MSPISASKDYQQTLEEIRGNALVAFLASIGIFVSLGLVVGDLLVDRLTTDIVIFCVGMTIVCGLTYSLMQYSYLLACHAFIVLFSIIIAQLLQQFQNPMLPYLFIIPIQLAVVLRGIKEALFILLLISMYLLFVIHESIFGAFGVIWLSFFTGVLIARTMYKSLGVIQDYAIYANQQMQVAREQRAQLAKLSKALHDITHDLEHANRQLSYAREVAEEARRLKAQFAATVSHELRTPINLIVGYSEVMAYAPEIYEHPLPSAYRSDVQAIYRNARHLQNLINDILDISQIEAERLSIIKEKTNLTELLQETGQMMRDLISAKGLEFHLTTPPDLPNLWIDRTRVRQVIINLLANAVRFTDQGQIKLEACIQEKTILIRVIDTGIGISEVDFDKVFQTFYQVEGALTRKQGGTGLGLFLSQQFIQQHGGKLWVESVVGQGSTFSFTLPLSNLYDEKAPLISRPKLSSGIQHVLVFDDDPAIVQLFRGYLPNVKVLEAQTTEKALAMLQSIQPSVMVMDEGYMDPEFLAHVTAQSPHTIVFSCPLPSGKRTVQAQGIADFLVKPVSRQALFEALDNLETRVENILLIDDEYDITDLFRKMLLSSQRQYTIREAHNGREGLAEIKKKRPDAVILDILMPDVDGFGVLQHMKADPVLQTIPVIVASARGIEEAITPNIEGRISILKPSGFTSIELVNAVRALTYPLREHIE